MTLEWFAKHAPIRTKFRVLAGTHATLGGIAVAITALTATGTLAIGPAFDIAVVATAVASIVPASSIAHRVAMVFIALVSPPFGRPCDLG